MQISPGLSKKVAQAIQTSMQIEGCKPAQSDAIKQQARALMKQHRIHIFDHSKSHSAVIQESTSC